MLTALVAGRVRWALLPPRERVTQRGEPYRPAPRPAGAGALAASPTGERRSRCAR